MAVLPDEVQEAIDILADAERENDPLEKVRDFRQGFEILIVYETDTTNLPPEILNKIKNYKKSYTRSLINQLPSLMEVDIEVWFDYIKLIGITLDKEKQILFTENPILAEIYHDFTGLWRQELLEAFEATQR